MTDTLAYVISEQWLRENTHGHVIEHIKGAKSKAKCGGIEKCGVCKVESELWKLIDSCRRNECRHPMDRTLWVDKRQAKTKRLYYECKNCGGFIGYINE